MQPIYEMIVPGLYYLILLKSTIDTCLFVTSPTKAIKASQFLDLFTFNQSVVVEPDHVNQKGLYTSQDS